MNYEQAKKLKPGEFKRLCGVTLQTFKQMVKIVEKHFKVKKKTGRPSKLSLENQILMILEYLSGHLTILRKPQNPCP